MSTTPVSTLLSHLPYPDSPWVLSESLQARVDQTPNSTSTFKRCEVLPSDKEWAFVNAAFEQQKPTTYGIKRVYYVYREPISVAFHNHLSTADEAAETFQPLWRQGVPHEERLRVMERWNRFIGSGVSGRNVHVIPLWHGSTKEIFENICKLGFRILGTGQDEGFFGRGAYFATTAGYAVDAYSKDGHVLLSFVSMREPYPVLYKDFQDDRPNAPLKHPFLGKGGKDNHDAHYIPVISGQAPGRTEERPG